MPGSHEALPDMTTAGDLIETVPALDDERAHVDVVGLGRIHISARRDDESEEKHDEDAHDSSS